MQQALAQSPPEPAPHPPTRRDTRDRSNRISPKVRKALRLLATGECSTQRAAAERAGLTECYLSTLLKTSKVRLFLEQTARQTIATGQLRASNRLIGLLDAESEHVSLDASKHVLAIAGIKPDEGPQVAVNVSVTPGYVIDLGQQPMHTIEGSASEPDDKDGG